MFESLKKYLIGSLLEKETDTIKLANITVIFFITVVPFCLLLVLLVSYLIIGNAIQVVIGLVSLAVFFAAMWYVKAKEDILLVSHLLLTFSSLIFALNAFMYPDTGLVNGVLLSCNIIFAFNFFDRITASIYCFFSLLAGIVSMVFMSLKIDIPFIEPIHQSLFEMILTYSLLLVMVVVLIVYYQTVHKAAAVRLGESLSALKISEDRRKKSQAIGLVGNWEYDLIKNELHWDEEAYRIYGVETSQTTHLIERLMSMIHPDDLEHVRTFANHVARNRVYNFDYRIIRPDGIERFVSIFAEFQFDANGIPLRYYGIVQDITDRKKSEAEQKKLLEITSLQNSKLKNFTYIVSHNVRSHSSNITSLVNFLSATNDENERNEIIKMLVNTSNNLETTLLNLNDIISINEDTAKPRTVIYLKNEIDKTLDVLSGEIIKHNVQINNNVNPESTITAIPSYCESILLNLISNAIKYRSDERNPKIDISVDYVPNFVVLKISDNGLGIDLKKNGNKIFGMYKTFHQNEDSRGIGLYLTKNHIESMNGKIEIESKVNVGTTFKVFFNDKY
jgi:PAS domain S-box-containing protein